MGTRKRVEVVINGQAHGFIVEDEAALKELAEYVNKKVMEVIESPSGKLLPNDKKYVFAAMNMAEDFFVLNAKYEELVEKAGKQSGDRIAGLKEEIERLRKERADLAEKLQAAEYELKYVQQLYEEQKREYEQLLEEVTSPENKDVQAMRADGGEND